MIGHGGAAADGIGKIGLETALFKGNLRRKKKRKLTTNIIWVKEHERK